MNAAFWLSLVMAAAGCAGLLMAGRGMWQGWAVGLAVQPVWILFAVLTEGYGLVLNALLYAGVYARNLVKWRRERAASPDEAPPPAPPMPAPPSRPSPTGRGL